MNTSQKRIKCFRVNKENQAWSRCPLHKAAAVLLRDTPGKRMPCLHGQAFAGQRTATGFAWSCPQYRSG